jgi:hypothetical protein
LVGSPGSLAFHKQIYFRHTYLNQPDTPPSIWKI